VNTVPAIKKYFTGIGSVTPFGDMPSKKGIAYETLKARILSNQYRPGMPINESALCEELKFSKTPIREALQQLERESFISTVPGRGSFVTHVTLEDVREIFDSREIVESAVARRAALVGDKELIRAKKLELEALSPSDHNNTDADVDRDDVHVFIFHLVGNQWLFSIYSQLLDRILRLRNYFSVRLDTDRTAHYNQEHLKILNALLAGEPDQVEEAVLTHLRNASTYLSRLTSR
jgi:DNA-binding GntR family transcriptional regulator